MEISSADINRVARIMDKDFSDAERTDVIQCMECCDVNACPGSGKTTTMVAKLMILSEKLAGTMTGICALSHTNAAKNEIKKTLGTHAGRLMQYPHFIGTIQTFTDLFLAVPSYIEEYGHRPIAIDDEQYEYVAKKRFSRLSSRTRYALNQHTHDDGQKLFCDTVYSFSNFELVTYDSNREEEFFCRPTTQTYQEVLRGKQEITSLGYLTYHDAFAYANRHLRKYPRLSTIIASRFSYVFIDEMQDTDAYQNELLENIFRGQSVIQKFGDPNQTIYSQRFQGEVPIWRPEGDHAITTSRRLSPSISRLSQGICTNPQEIRGNENIPEYPHTIILFDQRQRENVIPRFGQILENEHLQDGPFKALGAIGRPNQNANYLSITSYWPNFLGRQQFSLANNPFWGLILQARSSILLTQKYSEAYQMMTKAFIELLQAQHIRNQYGHSYTPTYLLKCVHDSGIDNLNDYKRIMLANCEYLLNHADLEIEETIAQAQLIFSFLNHRLERLGEDVIRNRGQAQPLILPPARCNLNVYSHQPNIAIEIDTIHSAKGQTHQATLVLETYFTRPDLSTIVEYLAGGNNPRAGVRIRNRFLPLTYVACTRPTHLLCLAIQSNHLNDSQINLLNRFGWRIDVLN